MTSFLAWLDSSESERRKALDVIDLFKQQETVDELGIGSVRDTIADALTPGTSTIQTRARYFFLVPWAYLELERSRSGDERIAVRARRLEIATVLALLPTQEAGVIGRQAGARLKRLPSAIYWAGLRRLGFRLFPGALDQYHRLFRRLAMPVIRDDTGDLGPAAGPGSNWNPHLPAAPADFPEIETLSLTRGEAEFFQEQLRQHAHGTLLQSVVDFGAPVRDVEYPWEHSRVGDMPAPLRQWLSDGRQYSELIYGAQVLYNLMLAERIVRLRDDDMSNARLEMYMEYFLTWAEEVAQAGNRHAAWDRPAFWARLRSRNPQLSERAQRFSEAWIEAVLAAPAAASLLSDGRARALIAERERSLKGSRARLFSHEQLQMWGGASGVGRLNYRWRNTVQIVNDIVAGLGRS